MKKAAVDLDQLEYNKEETMNIKKSDVKYIILLPILTVLLLMVLMITANNLGFKCETTTKKVQARVIWKGAALMKGQEYTPESKIDESEDPKYFLTILMDESTGKTINCYLERIYKISEVDDTFPMEHYEKFGHFFHNKIYDDYEFIN